ncbi:FtsX-like permease family protein [Lactobacillus sp. YT155]|uniref:ABC transporter permease n=1 Tax=Lactobacillus sp. YT155 TaxID=3060955 RepID=UPI00265F69A4|nr:FtsX-like permease family protein [Lactobacillus sp. YT155]MDO1604699.1 FtsX-like permease family protein [Lactobacillus sp. YT155]
MIRNLIKKDFKKNKIITLTLFVFILLSSMLVSSSLTIVTELNGSLNNLFEKSKVPSYVQMYSGDISQAKIDKFTKKNDLVKHQQTVEMLGISGENLFLQGNNESEVNSIIENSFVKQNPSFDFLLDTNNKVAKIADGKIGIPVYHQQKYNLKLGSKVKVKLGDYEKTFVISAFIRDSQMNPSLVTSKRILLSSHDWAQMKKKIQTPEYLVEFELKNEADISKFEKQYQKSKLPQSGTALTRTLYTVLNSMTDGIIVAIITLISLLLILIAALCLRFSILTSIEEDYREIGIMKAIGISNKNTKKIYMVKYTVLSATACLVGFLSSILITSQFTKSMTDYMGTTPKTAISYLLPFVGSLVVFGLVYLFCKTVFRRFKKISAYNALQASETTSNRKIARRMSLTKKKGFLFGPNVFIGIRDVLTKIKTYLLLTVIYSICVFLMSVPLSFLQTVQSPSFISYMGAGKSDLRIDAHQVDKNKAEFQKLQTELKQNSDVKNLVVYSTSSYQIKNSDGELVTTKIESTNDYQTYPLKYVTGSAPKTANEIALSSMNADEFGAGVGDKLTVYNQGKKQKLKVSGIYQDVTNGGKTAKAKLSSKDVLWYTFNFNLKDPSKTDEFKTKLTKEFKHIKVTNTDEYIHQTLGGIIQQVSNISVVSFVLAVFIAILITFMFFKMTIAKETKDIAIMKSIGISNKTVRVQYLTRSVMVSIFGIVLGILLTNLLGPKVATLLISGVSNLTFTNNFVLTYLLIPLLLIIVATISTWIVSSTIKKIKVMTITE